MSEKFPFIKAEWNFNHIASTIDEEMSAQGENLFTFVERIGVFVRQKKRFGSLGKQLFINDVKLMNYQTHS